MEQKVIKQHTFRYENNKVTIQGVTNIDSFDTKEVVVSLTEQGLTLKGDNFVLLDTDINSGLCTLSGNLISLNYHKKMEKLSFIKGLFK